MRSLQLGLGQALGWYAPGEGAGLIGAVVGAIIVRLSGALLWDAAARLGSDAQWGAAWKASCGLLQERSVRSLFRRCARTRDGPQRRNGSRKRRQGYNDPRTQDEPEEDQLTTCHTQTRRCAWVRVMEMDELPIETKEQVFRALGEAVVKIWSRLPQDVQHDLFEGAVASQGESKRQQLAVFLHGQHSRTSDAVKSRADAGAGQSRGSIHPRCPRRGRP